MNVGLESNIARRSLTKAWVLASFFNSLIAFLHAAGVVLVFLGSQSEVLDVINDQPTGLPLETVVRGVLALIAALFILIGTWRAHKHSAYGVALLIGLLIFTLPLLASSVLILFDHGRAGPLLALSCFQLVWTVGVWWYLKRAGWIGSWSIK